jgi:ABC-type bacteriocin/lantibiotic exporter with double-glycine peptidase domain
VASSGVAADSGWIRVEHLPPVRQAGAKDCGAAVLSSVLHYWERSPSPAAERSAIDAALRQDPKQGLSAGALRNYARAQGFRAFVFQGTLADLNHEVAQGRPVIVGVHKALSDGKALTHYEVFLGIHPQKQLVLTFDPARGLEENSLAGFLQEWDGSGQVTLVVLPSATRS